MDWHELMKMKVTDLRELAKEKTDLEGVTAMHKEDLVEKLAAALGIPKPHKVVDRGTGKGRLKVEIRELKVLRDQALANRDAGELRRLRREIRKRKRALRHMAHVVK